MVQVAKDSTLLTKEYVHELAKRLLARGMSRQETAVWLSDTLFSYEGEVLDGSGKPLDLHDEVIDEAFGHDLWFTWCSAVKELAGRMPGRKPKQGLLLRLQLFDAAFRIEGSPINIGL